MKEIYLIKAKNKTSKLHKNTIIIRLMKDIYLIKTKKKTSRLHKNTTILLK